MWAGSAHLVAAELLPLALAVDPPAIILHAQPSRGAAALLVAPGHRTGTVDADVSQHDLPTRGRKGAHPQAAAAAAIPTRLKLHERVVGLLEGGPLARGKEAARQSHEVPVQLTGGSGSVGVGGGGGGVGGSGGVGGGGGGG